MTNDFDWSALLHEGEELRWSGAPSLPWQLPSRILALAILCILAWISGRDALVHNTIRDACGIDPSPKCTFAYSYLAWPTFLFSGFGALVMLGSIFLVVSRWPHTTYSVTSHRVLRASVARGETRLAEATLGEIRARRVWPNTIEFGSGGHSVVRFDGLTLDQVEAVLYWTGRLEGTKAA